MKHILTLIIAILTFSQPCEAEPQTYTWRQALDAIRQVETGGRPNEGIGCRGDDGFALGPYQIWSAYHIDAAERDKTLTNYQRCLTSKEYSERVVSAYMGRYARAERDRLKKGKGTLADVQKVARIHNGGPRGHKKKATEHYWRKVLRHLPKETK